MKHPTNHIFEHTPDSLKEWCATHGMKPFRAAQILEWVYEKRITDPAVMSNLSGPDKQVLARDMTFESGRVVRHQKASDGVQKLLMEWDEGTEGRRDGGEGEGGAKGGSGVDDMGRDAHATQVEPTGLASRLRVVGQPVLGVVEGPEGDTRRQTECVMIPSEDQAGPRRTACVSSQVGCPVGCRFCASGLGGLDGNLSAGRIVEQVWKLGTMLEPAKERAPKPGEVEALVKSRLPRISNVVFMGMGEPLSNFAAVTHAVRTIAGLWALGISARKITISTVGLPKAIERLAEELELPVTLALSLHAPNDKLRRQLIPWAEYTTIAELLGACKKWFEKTGREITLEYTLLRGVNDRPEHAAELAQVAKTLRANINLIRYNEVAGLEFARPKDDDVREFQRILRAKDVNAHIRASRGRDIAAACGQLRHEAAAV